MCNKWNKINTEKDLEKINRNKYNKDISEYILVSSSKYCHLNEIYLVYFNFLDNKFHFPFYGNWAEDVELLPVKEIDRWQRLPKPPRVMKDRE